MLFRSSSIYHHSPLWWITCQLQASLTLVMVRVSRFSSSFISLCMAVVAAQPLCANKADQWGYPYTERRNRDMNARCDADQRTVRASHRAKTNRQTKASRAQESQFVSDLCVYRASFCAFYLFIFIVVWLIAGCSSIVVSGGSILALIGNCWMISDSMLITASHSLKLLAFERRWQYSLKAFEWLKSSSSPSSTPS